MADWQYPDRTCGRCGETKSLQLFTRRYGIRYDLMGATDPNRYGPTCKRCHKPAKPGQTREDVEEIKRLRTRQTGKKMAKVKKNLWRKRRKAAATARRSMKSEREWKNEYKQKIRRETRIKSMVYLAEKGCAECGERDPRCLEYDHKAPQDKKRNVGRLIIDGFSWSSRTLTREIKKCRILCSNCHRKHTIEQQGYYAHEEVQRTLGELAARYKFDL